MFHIHNFERIEAFRLMIDMLCKIKYIPLQKPVFSFIYVHVFFCPTNFACQTLVIVILGSNRGRSVSLEEEAGLLDLAVPPRFSFTVYNYCLPNRIQFFSSEAAYTLASLARKAFLSIIVIFQPQLLRMNFKNCIRQIGKLEVQVCYYTYIHSQRNYGRRLKTQYQPEFNLFPAIRSSNKTTRTASLKEFPPNSCSLSLLCQNISSTLNVQLLQYSSHIQLFLENLLSAVSITSGVLSAHFRSICRSIVGFPACKLYFAILYRS